MTMSFTVSPQLREYGDTIRDWAATQVRPHARQADTDHAPPSNWHEIVATCPVSLGKGDPRTELERLRFDDGYWVKNLVTTEALAYGDHWVSFVLGNGIGHLVVRGMGTPEQIERWYDPIASKGGITAFGLTEPHFGSDTSMVATTATRDGDTWVLNGTKMYCTYGAIADYVIVFATLDAEAGPSAIKAFVVEAGTPGFNVGKENEDKLGIRSWVTSELVFDECVIPVDHQLGWQPEHDEPTTPGKGQTRSGRGGALGALATNKPNISALGVGMAQASVDVATLQLHEQRAGFAPHRWTMIESELEQMNRSLDRARIINFSAQWRQDNAIHNKTEASISKAYGPPNAERIIRRCMQLLGPEGASTDLLLEKWYRDVKILDIFEGSGQVQRVIVGRSLMGRDSGRN